MTVFDRNVADVSKKFSYLSYFCMYSIWQQLFIFLKGLPLIGHPGRVIIIEWDGRYTVSVLDKAVAEAVEQKSKSHSSEYSQQHISS